MPCVVGMSAAVIAMRNVPPPAAAVAGTTGAAAATAAVEMRLRLEIARPEIAFLEVMCAEPYAMEIWVKSCDQLCAGLKP